MSEKESLHIEINNSRILTILANVSPEVMRNAQRRAIRKTLNFVKSKINDEVVNAIGLPSDVVLRRVRLYLHTMKGKAWIGINPIQAERLGTPQQTSSGVTVGRHSFRSAWLMKSRPNGPVYRRTGTGGIERVYLDWSEKGKIAFRKAAGQARAHFLKTIEQEVFRELNKAVHVL
jgi:hypothetical protein